MLLIVLVTIFVFASAIVVDKFEAQMLGHCVACLKRHSVISNSWMCQAIHYRM
eukprot:m.335854 g.335854  ORF g.335854 m.335854 type:complete len:53 (-) comp16077_c1_seq11:3663-3821(-)